LYIFRARDFPENYYTYYFNGDEENPVSEKVRTVLFNQPFHVYIAYVDNKPCNLSSESNSMNKNKELMKRYKNMPVVVVNPSDILSKFDINQVSVSYISK
jgi:hypothetical protein